MGLRRSGAEPRTANADGSTVSRTLGLGELTLTPPPKLDELGLRAPRVSAPTPLASILSADPYDRAAHTYGKSSADLVRAFRRDFRNPPDLVAFPKSEADIVHLLDWCTNSNIVAIPYGGGSSVVG